MIFRNKKLKRRPTTLWSILLIIVGCCLVIYFNLFWRSFFSGRLGTEVSYPFGWIVEEATDEEGLFVHNHTSINRLRKIWPITIAIKKGEPCLRNCDAAQIIDAEIALIAETLPEGSAATIKKTVAVSNHSLAHPNCHTETKDFFVPSQSVSWNLLPNRLFGLVCQNKTYTVRVAATEHDFNRANRIAAKIAANLGVR
ncbi:MAG: hypothetical protein AAF614_08790 [Chloroflexota bacterium]